MGVGVMKTWSTTSRADRRARFTATICSMVAIIASLVAACGSETSVVPNAASSAASTPGSGSTGSLSNATVPTNPGIRVCVLVAAEQIQRGTTGAAAAGSGAIQWRAIPQSFRPGSAVVSVDEITTKVALFGLTPGTVIVKEMFVDPSTTGSTTINSPTLDSPSALPPGSDPPTATSALSSACDVDALPGPDLAKAWVIAREVPQFTEWQDAVAQGMVVRTSVDPAARPADAIDQVVEFTVNADDMAFVNLPVGAIVVAGMFVTSDVIRTFPQ